MTTTKKPTATEDEYFAREEARRKELRKIKEEQQSAEAAREARKGTCPRGCETKLVEEIHRELHIDRCPTCNGVWLDPGELEQISSDNAGVIRGFLTFLSGKH